MVSESKLSSSFGLSIAVQECVWGQGARFCGSPGLSPWYKTEDSLVSLSLDRPLNPDPFCCLFGYPCWECSWELSILGPLLPCHLPAGPSSLHYPTL